MEYITVDYIRECALDRFPEDNQIDNDLAFTDEEILSAMRRGCHAYNNAPPLGIESFSPNTMPISIPCLTEAVLYALYNAEVNRLARNQMTWDTGGVQVSLERDRFAAISRLRDECAANWREGAKLRKTQLNVETFYGFV